MELSFKPWDLVICASFLLRVLVVLLLFLHCSQACKGLPEMAKRNRISLFFSVISLLCIKYTFTQGKHGLSDSSHAHVLKIKIPVFSPFLIPCVLALFCFLIPCVVHCITTRNFDHASVKFPVKLNSTSFRWLVICAYTQGEIEAIEFSFWIFCGRKVELNELSD